MMVRRTLGAAGTVALGLLALGAPAFADQTPAVPSPILPPAQGNGDPVGSFSDKAQQTTHPLYLPLADFLGDGLHGALTSAGILDQTGGIPTSAN